jgi:hypothetical protein
MRFKKGQKVVCVKKGPWKNGPGWEDKPPAKPNDPAYNEIVTVASYYRLIEGDWFIFLYGYPYVYQESLFEPLIEDSVLEKELEGIKEVITV